MLALAGWYGGVVACGRMTMHRIALGETVALLKTLEEEISFRRANLNTVFRQFIQRGTFANVLPSHAAATFQTLSPPNCFTKEECAAFADCFSHLGYTNAAQECERLARYRKQFEAFHQAAIQNEQSALAIDRKIGLAIGSMLALVLL